MACGFRWPSKMKGHEILEVPPPDKVFDGHSVALVGYDDDAGEPGGGVFRFRNSDGPGWGDHGHGTMSYAYAHAYMNDSLWLHYEPPHAEVPTYRFEAENIRSGPGEVREQSADHDGLWPGNVEQGNPTVLRGEKGRFHRTVVSGPRGRPLSPARPGHGRS